MSRDVIFKIAFPETNHRQFHFLVTAFVRSFLFHDCGSRFLFGSLLTPGPGNVFELLLLSGHRPTIRCLIGLPTR